MLVEDEDSVVLFEADELTAVDFVEELAETVPLVEKTFTFEELSALQPESKSAAVHINIMYFRFI